MEESTTKNGTTIENGKNEDIAPLIEASISHDNNNNHNHNHDITTTTTTASISNNHNSQPPPKVEYRQHPKLSPFQWWILLLSDTISDISHYCSSKYQTHLQPCVSFHGHYYLPFFFSPSSSSRQQQQQQGRFFLHPKYLFLGCIILISLVRKIHVFLEKQQIKTFQLAQEQSFGYFSSISKPMWIKKQRRVQKTQRHAFPEDILKFIDEPNAWYHNNWDPDFTCQHERKLGGGLGDGPKWVCDPHRLAPSVLYRQEQNKLHYQSDASSSSSSLSTVEQKINDGCLIYSIGINNNGLNLEHELLDMIHKDDNDIGCEIHVFDPQSDKFVNEMMYSSTLPNKSSITFHPWGIKGSTDVKDPYRFKSFQDTLKKLHHVGRSIDILKVDCNMCEWSIYKDWFDEQLNIPRIGQILVKVHGSPEHVVNDFFETLVREEGYVIFHKEANTEFYGGMCQDYGFLKLRHDFFEIEE